MNSPKRRKPANATLQAVEKWISDRELEQESTSLWSVERDIGSAFFVRVRVGWQRLIPSSTLFSQGESNGLSEYFLSTWTDRSAESIDAIVPGLTFP